VTSAQFMRWLLRWQMFASGTQMQGESATLDVLRQLQGFEDSASAWERHFLGAYSNYTPSGSTSFALPVPSVGGACLRIPPRSMTRSRKTPVIPTQRGPDYILCAARKPTG